jgi:ubiquinone/menaquinone biosynthesis C-methylase UbiE
MVEVATRHAERADLTERVAFTVADLADLPLPDGSVDLIVSTASLHHWNDVGAVIASLGRVLRRIAAVCNDAHGDPRGRRSDGGCLNEPLYRRFAARRRAYWRRALARPPQSCMLHHRRMAFLVPSRNSQPQPPS